MARFESFQNTRVFNEKDNPLFEQIYFYGCIVNFENGYINNWDCEAEGETDCPAISCIDGYIEFWKQGVLNNRGDKPAVISNDVIEFWENGVQERNRTSDDVNENEELLNENKKETEESFFEKGDRAELALAKYLNGKEIPFIHFDQHKGDLYSDVLRKKSIKRPDYLIFIDKKPLFIEVKATSTYSINKRELRKLNNLKNEFPIDVILAITDINKKEYNDYSFTTLDNLNNYVEIIENDKDTSRRSFYYYSELLFENKLIPNNIDNDRLEEIYYKEGTNDKYHYSDLFRKYLTDNNYIIKEK